MFGTLPLYRFSVCKLFIYLFFTFPYFAFQIFCERFDTWVIHQMTHQTKLVFKGFLEFLGLISLKGVCVCSWFLLIFVWRSPPTEILLPRLNVHYPVFACNIDCESSISLVILLNSAGRIPNSKVKLSGPDFFNNEIFKYF